MIVVTLYQSFCAMIFGCDIKYCQDSVGNACFVHQATFSANFSIAFGSLAQPLYLFRPCLFTRRLGEDLNRLQLHHSRTHIERVPKL